MKENTSKMEKEIEYNNPKNAWKRIKSKFMILINNELNDIEDIYDMLIIEQAINELNDIKSSNHFPFKTINEYREFLASLKKDEF